MMMMTMGHCCRASTFLLACCSLLLCFWPHHEVFARVTIPRRRRTTAAAAANIFNGTQVGAYEGSSQLLLPAWATMEEEEDLQANRGNPRLGQSSLALNKQLIFQQQAAGQQQLPLRIPAEYEPVSTVIMAWNEVIRDMVSSMITSIDKAGSRAWLLIPHNVDVDVDDIPKKNVRTIKVNYDSIWTRDYGPVGGIVEDDNDSDRSTSSSASSRAIVNAVYQLADYRVYDDQVPCHMANSFRKKIPCRSTSIIMDGGNLMFDGQGGLFTTSITYDWNDHLTPQQVDTELTKAYGVDYIYSIDYAKIAGSRQPADGTGHLDMFAKILAPCVVIVAEAPQNNKAYYTVLNKAATYFSNLACQASDGSSSSLYQVYRVPGWENEEGIWYTYTNSLIVNDRVIVPSYYSDQKNNQALAVYNAAAPHLTVDFVNSDYIINLGGAVHCLTKEIPRLPKRQ